MDIAISGADLITSVAVGRQANFEAFCQSACGNKPLQCFDRSRYRLGWAYEIADRAEPGQDRPGRATDWLCHCIESATAAAALPLDGSARVAVLVGTGLRELRSLELAWVEGRPFPLQQLHFGAGVRRALGLAAPVWTLANACAASSFALGLAADMIALGEIDAAVVAGCDSITESMFGTFDRITRAPLERVVPFDGAGYKGVLMGEGAAAVVVEPAAQARGRGVPPLAQVRSVGITCDAHHETAPAPASIAAAMRDAHRRAGLDAAAIDLLLAHGTGTEQNDRAEAQAIKEVFGPASAHIPISGIKAMTGHTSGASGLVGVVTAIEALRQGRLPPTAGFRTPIPEASGLRIAAQAVPVASARLAQVNAFGFGGLNAVVILEKGEL